MSKLGPNCAAALAVGFLCFPAIAQAAPIVISDFSYSTSDVYFGGKNTHVPSGVGDVIGTSNFDTTGGTISKVGNDLHFTVNTNYANTVNPATNVGDLGTSVGAFFIGTGTPNYNNGTPGGSVTDPSGQYAFDTFKADPGRFDYAVVPGVGSSSATLVKLAGDGSDIQYSNYNGLTTGSNFRNDQAVGVLGSPAGLTSSTDANGNAFSLSSSWSLVPGATPSITFTILNFFKLTDIADSANSSLVFAWAMTCANDVFMASVQLPRDQTPPVPIPASALLLLTGLAGLGGLSRLRGKRVSGAAS